MQIPKTLLQQPLLQDSLEFLLTNGLGGYCNLSVNGILTRRHHGLLITSKKPPMERHLSWHNIVEYIDDIRIPPLQPTADSSDLNCQNAYMESFLNTPLPTWRYYIQGVWLEKQCIMPPEDNTLIFKYRLLTKPDRPVRLRLDNLVHFRPINDCLAVLNEQAHHWLIDPTHNVIGTETCQLFFNSKGRFEWYAETECHNRFQYYLENHDQGYPVEDSSFRANSCYFTLRSTRPVFISGSASFQGMSAKKQFHQAVSDQKSRKHHSDNSTHFKSDLKQSVYHFIARRTAISGKTLLAGFPWFGDWGRDTMIALPGVCLVTGEYEIAKLILETFAKYCHRGRLPNKFPDHHLDELQYNSLDASLWYFYAIQKYIEYTGDWQWVIQRLFPVLEAIIQQHINGLDDEIFVDDQGLLQGGNATTQLTWMDAKYNNHAVTPRWGKAVEINALWYNALCFFKELQIKASKSHQKTQQLINVLNTSFSQCFWLEQQGYLADYVNDEGINSDMRPNQIIAVSLPYTPLSPEQQASVLKSVQQRLYTPMGLRTLPVDHPDYHHRYYGSLKDRDDAYHQGTVWPWLIGPFIDAYIRVKGDNKGAAALLARLKHHFYFEAGVHCISEVADGDAPHKARGCFHQAWSVAEVLRVIHEHDLSI